MNLLKKIKNTYDKHREVMRSVSAEEVMSIAQSYNGRLTPRSLARSSSLNYLQASLKLNCLFEKGYFSMSWTNTSEVYILREGRASKMATITPVKRFLTDAEVLKAALENEGTLTPASLCVALNCTLEAAQKKLDSLQQQDIFRLEIADKGTILYMLNDMDYMKVSDGSVKEIE